MNRADYLSRMVDAYLECAAWSSSHTTSEDGSETVPFDEIDADWSPEASKRAEEDCADFYDGNRADLKGMDPDQAGHDFWLTRCGHGAGFWDRGLGARGDRLSKACEPYGNVDPYLGDDGLIHVA